MTTSRFSIVLVASGIAGSTEATPLGAANLAAALAAHAGCSAVDLELLELEGEPTDHDLSLMSRADVVAFSVYVWNRTRIFATASRIKKSFPHIILCAGGPEVTADPARALGQSPFDFVVSGEGEDSFCAAVALLVKGGIAALREAPTEGICLPGRAVTRSKAPALGELPSPWLGGVLKPHAQQTVLWELSRGCPCACSFCFESKGTGGVRHFSVSRLRAELELFASCGVRSIFVLDPSFNADKKTCMKLLDLVEEWGQTIHFRFEIRAEFLDEAQADAFSRINCALQIGLQSADAKVLKHVDRVFDRVQFARKVALLNARGVVFGFDLIWGLPGDTLGGFVESLNWAVALQPNHLDLFCLSVLPGTKLWSDAKGFGLVFDQDAPYRLVSQPSFSEADMEEARKLAADFDLFYNKGRAVAWFKPVCKAFRLEPSAMVRGFAETLDHAGRDDFGSIAIAQREHVAKACADKALVELVRDIICYQAAWCSAFAEGETSVIELDASPDWLDEALVRGLRGAVQGWRRVRQRWRVSPHPRGGVKVVRAGR